MKASPVAFYFVGFIFAALAAWRVIQGVSNTTDMIVLVILVLGAMATLFLYQAQNMKIKSGSFSIEIIHQSEALLGVGGPSATPGKKDRPQITVDDEDVRVTSERSDVPIGLPESTMHVRHSSGMPMMESCFSSPRRDPDDPHKNQFGGISSRDGLHVSATVSKHPENPKWAVVRLTASDARNSDHLNFHLHPTFKQSVVRVPRAANQYAFVLIAWGAFTIGIEAPDGRKVEIDLSNCDGGPETFYTS